MLRVISILIIIAGSVVLFCQVVRGTVFERVLLLFERLRRDDVSVLVISIRICNVADKHDVVKICRVEIVCIYGGDGYSIYLCYFIAVVGFDNDGFGNKLPARILIVERYLDGICSVCACRSRRSIFVVIFDRCFEHKAGAGLVDNIMIIRRRSILLFSRQGLRACRFAPAGEDKRIGDVVVDNDCLLGIRIFQEVADYAKLFFIGRNIRVRGCPAAQIRIDERAVRDRVRICRTFALFKLSHINIECAACVFETYCSCYKSDTCTVCGKFQSLPFTYIVTFKPKYFFGNGTVRRFKSYGKSAVFIICALCYIRELYINRESMFSLFTRYIEKAEADSLVFRFRNNDFSGSFAYIMLGGIDSHRCSRVGIAAEAFIIFKTRVCDKVRRIHSYRSAFGYLVAGGNLVAVLER